jgi:hypothetical protein
MSAFLCVRASQSLSLKHDPRHHSSGIACYSWSGNAKVPAPLPVRAQSSKKQYRLIRAARNSYR